MSNTSILFSFTRQDLRFSFLKRINNSIDVSNINVDKNIFVRAFTLVKETLFFADRYKAILSVRVNIYCILLADNCHKFVLKDFLLQLIIGACNSFNYRGLFNA